MAASLEWSRTSFDGHSTWSTSSAASRLTKRIGPPAARARWTRHLVPMQARSGSIAQTPHEKLLQLVAGRQPLDADAQWGAASRGV
jgi:hypothetical protein